MALHRNHSSLTFVGSMGWYAFIRQLGICPSLNASLDATSPPQRCLGPGALTPLHYPHPAVHGDPIPGAAYALFVT